MRPGILIFFGLTYLFVLCFLSIDVGIIKVFSVILSNLVSGYGGYLMSKNQINNNSKN